MKPYYDHGGVTLWHGDCREARLELDLSGVSLLLSDPPYGIGYKHRKVTSGKWTTRHHNEPIVGDDAPFDPSPWLAFPKVILWGGNHFAGLLPRGGGWFVWDKRRGVEKVDFSMSDAEIAWTNTTKATRLFRHLWFGLARDSEIGQHLHPTQKPVALMAWCISQSKIPSGSLVLDPYMGSGPVVRAAKDAGCRAIGIEIEERYCEIAARRLDQGVFTWQD